MPAIGRFLIVVTFLEDALRIITQWSDQILYLHDYRHSTHTQILQGLGASIFGNNLLTLCVRQFPTDSPICS